LARSYTEAAIRAIAGICLNGTSESARVQAAALLLDRGWGKAAQSQTGEHDKAPMIVEIVYRQREPRIIEPPAKIIQH
jgi:hypothetical protein